jgi:hypothetical protein
MHVRITFIFTNVYAQIGERERQRERETERERESKNNVYYICTSTVDLFW